MLSMWKRALLVSALAGEVLVSECRMYAVGECSNGSCSPNVSHGMKTYGGYNYYGQPQYMPSESVAVMEQPYPMSDQYEMLELAPEPVYSLSEPAYYSEPFRSNDVPELVLVNEPEVLDFSPYASSDYMILDDSPMEPTYMHNEPTYMHNEPIYMTNDLYMNHQQEPIYYSEQIPHISPPNAYIANANASQMSYNNQYQHNSHTQENLNSLYNTSNTYKTQSYGNPNTYNKRNVNGMNESNVVIDKPTLNEQLQNSTFTDDEVNFLNQSTPSVLAEFTKDGCAITVDGSMLPAKADFTVNLEEPGNLTLKIFGNEVDAVDSAYESTITFSFDSRCNAADVNAQANVNEAARRVDLLLPYHANVNYADVISS